MNFLDFLRASGLLPRDVVADSRWHRCATVDHPKKRNGAYKFTGDVGFCRDWAVHDKALVWHPDRQDKPYQVDYLAINRRRSEERRKAVQATQSARTFYLACQPLVGGHPYLQAHQLDMTGCYGLKIDSDGWLVVPVMKDRNVMSVQRISPAGKKLFWTDAPTKGGSYTIEHHGAQVQILCEGLATGLALFAAVRLARIVVCFVSGNLSGVVIPRRGMVVVAADNDHATEARLGHNPGLDAAHVAAKAIGCGVAVPEDMTGSDWCDWRNEKVAQMLIDRPKDREASIRKAVDAEITGNIMRWATYLHS